VEPSLQIPDIQEIVMNTSLLYEGTLHVGDKLVHVRGKAGGRHLGDNLGNGMNEAYWSKIGNVLGSILLGDKHNVCGVEPMQVVGAQIGEVVDHGQEVVLNYAPTRFEESPLKLSGPGVL
jgi:hypothetical protein